MYSQYATGTSVYTFQPGDTLNSVANRFNVSLETICQANPGVNLNRLRAGQVICIPSVTPPLPTPYSNVPSECAGCPFYPRAQSLDTMNDPVVPSQQQGPPTGPPPDFIPQEPPSTFRVDPGAISRCVFRFSYLWLTNGQSFWAYLVFVGRTSVAGWRFQRGRWTYFGVDLREIRSFQCF